MNEQASVQTADFSNLAVSDQRTHTVRLRKREVRPRADLRVQLAVVERGENDLANPLEYARKLSRRGGLEMAASTGQDIGGFDRQAATNLHSCSRWCRACPGRPT
jgi:hypothetical protein